VRHAHGHAPASAGPYDAPVIAMRAAVWKVLVAALVVAGIGVAMASPAHAADVDILGGLPATA
jgi:hypothetical protein